MSYQVDRAWSDRFLPELRRLIGPHLLVPSSLEQDTKQVADLVVLRGRDLMIACRVRRPGYATLFPNQFTIRSRRDNGAKTELSKITDGWGDWFFYGHADTDERGIALWWLIDLSAWRAHLIRDGQRKQKHIRHGDRSNGDGTCFHWFDIGSFQSHPPLLIAQSAQAPMTDGEPTPVTQADISW
jgi:hypothetical protein